MNQPSARLQSLATTGRETKSATISTAAKAITHGDFGFTQANLDNAHRARISCDAEQIRYTYDGTTPTATLGHPVKAEETVVVEGNDNINNLQFIRSEAADAEVTVTLED